MGNISKQVDKLFSAWDNSASPGCALGVIRNGKFVCKRGYGMASLEHWVPITPDSAFGVASTSKQFTAACVAMLARRGKLSLDDKLQKHIPEIPVYKSPITLRHLIHHTSGLRDYLTLMSLAGMRLENKYSNEEVIALIARQKDLNFKPGSEHVYCNTGYLLLAETVKRVSGLPLRQYAHKHLFAPLGMKSTYFQDDLTEVIKNRASGYAKDKRGYKISTSLFDTVGDGGLSTTLNDLALWDRNFYDNRIGGFGPAFIKELTTPGRLNSGSVMNYAFGLFIENYNGLKTVHHGGSWYGNRCELIRFPEQKFSVICLANNEAIDAIALARKVADLYLASELSRPAGPQSKAGVARRLPITGKTGFYLNQKTGRLAELSYKSGYTLGIHGRTPKLERITAAQLQTANGAARIDFTAPQAFTLTANGGEKTLYTWLPPIKLSPTQAKRYSGKYYSAELDNLNEITAKGSALTLTARALPPEKLLPMKGGVFKCGPERTLRFDTSAPGSFTLSTGRVQGLRFHRK